MTASADTLNARLPARALAPAKINLGLFVGPARDDGRHELVSVMQSISLADELTLSAAAPAPARTRCAARRSRPAQREPRAARAGGLSRSAPAGMRRRCAWRSPSGYRSPPGWAAARPMPPPRCAWPAHASGLGDEELLRELAAQLGADVPAQVRPGTLAGQRRRRAAAGAPRPPRRSAVLVLALARESSRPPRSMRRPTGSAWPASPRAGRAARGARGALRAALELAGRALPADSELLRQRPQRRPCRCARRSRRPSRRRADAGADRRS